MKPKLIMLHGALGAYEKMHKLGNRMSDHYDVVGFTMKGHGEDANSPGFSIADFVDQLSDFVKYHKYQRYAILGYSLGGYVAFLCFNQAARFGKDFHLWNEVYMERGICTG